MTALDAAALRTAFDRAFAAEPEIARDETADLIGISLAGSPYALPLDSISSLHTNKKITRIPVQARGLLGIAGFRGTIVPVYDLALLVGLAPTENPRWLALTAKYGLAIAFETFDGHIRLPKDAVVPNESKEGGREYLRHLVRTDHALRGVIDLATALRPVLGQDLAEGNR